MDGARVIIRARGKGEQLAVAQRLAVCGMPKRVEGSVSAVQLLGRIETGNWRYLEFLIKGGAWEVQAPGDPTRGAIGLDEFITDVLDRNSY